MSHHSAAPQSNAKRYWGEEKNIDSIYSIYIKKICYNHSNNVNTAPIQAQTLLWETRKIKILQAATLDHVLKFMLLIKTNHHHPNPRTTNGSSNGTSSPSSSPSMSGLAGRINNGSNNGHTNGEGTSTNSTNSIASSSADDEGALDEERNNVAHIIHVFFCTYRIYTNPYELMLKLLDYSDICRIEQYRFVMYYWMDNYPEDFDYVINQDDKTDVKLVDELLRLCPDEHIKARASKLHDLKRGSLSTSGSVDSSLSETTGRRRSSSSNRHSHHYVSSSKNSAVLDLDSRYVSQQLTAIDLENFLNLRLHGLLDGSKSDKRIQSMIKNFNLLSRQVVVTILKAHNPNIVTAHWIAIAMNLRKIKNFNSLKAIIAGLTNESIYRLKQLIWNKLDRISMANFKLLASIVDDVNNQIVLRQTQLVVEGTAKMSIEDDSFGTIPYLGTFLTDLNMIDARHQSYVPSPKDETSKLKLINFEKCAKQFEILTQVQLLQKNVLASLHAIQRRNNFDEQINSSRLKLEQFNQSHQMLSAKPMIPKVTRVFENWFFDENISSMTDKQCYEISVSLEQNTIQR